MNTYVHAAVMLIRAFIAAEAPPLPKLAELSAQLRRAEPSLKMADVGQAHVTLKFLGQVEERRVPEIVEAMRGAVEGRHAFRAACRGCGQFPPKGAPRTIWAGVEDGGGLARLAGAIEESLAPLGFQREARPFRPHLTLARAREGSRPGGAAAFVARHADDDLGGWDVSSVSLKRSVLGPQGPAYSDLAVVKLRITDNDNVA